MSLAAHVGLLTYMFYGGSCLVDHSRRFLHQADEGLLQCRREVASIYQAAESVHSRKLIFGVRGSRKLGFRG